MSSDKPKPDESFLTRWSRRKRSEEKPAEEQDDLTKRGTATKVEDDQNLVNEDLSDLPNIEDLLPTSDVAAFLRKGVPEELKRQALRRAWSLDPNIRDFVEVAENQYDWNTPGGVPGFGELPAGLDLKALLAQATGALQSEHKSLNYEAASSSAGAPRAAMEPVAAVHGVESQPGQIATDPPIVEMRSEAPAKATADTARNHSRTQPAKRRRHGGALPT